MDFRPYYDALTERLTQDLGSAVARVTRENLPAASFPEQPALVVLPTTMEGQGGTRTPVLWELGATLVLHTRVSAADEKPDEQVLGLIEQIEGALRHHPPEPKGDGIGYWTTLGGKVLWAILEGAAIEDDMMDAAQTSTKLQVKMLTRG